MGSIPSKRERTGKAGGVHEGRDAIRGNGLVDFGVSNLKLEFLKLRPFNISKCSTL